MPLKGKEKRKIGKRKRPDCISSVKAHVPKRRLGIVIKESENTAGLSFSPLPVVNTEENSCQK